VDFDPEEVDEADLIELLSNQLHSQFLLRPASPDSSGSLLRATSAAEQNDPTKLLRVAEGMPCAPS
jgi:hypothetical protein